ncbi:decaprenyl-phosphate phosphoribosyltransferase [Candidatus Dojkabacteria bacterium]|nr:decaprenyl-phosphate phosphoribosyltransferase [Candidatus Dojkabacteria bacterium]
MAKIIYRIKLLRPHQYLKNLFIFLPLFFAADIFEINLLIKAGVAFIAFSLTASACYVFNDYLDIEADRKHPKKKKRPLASGKISKKEARIYMAILPVIGFIIAAPLGIAAIAILAWYFVQNILYTIKLKHIPIIDVFIIALGFVIRILIGGAATGEEISMWIIIMTFLLALFLGLAKRRDDVVLYKTTGKKMRKAVDGYNLVFLDTTMIMMTSVVLVAYIMYTVTPEAIAKFGTDKLYITTIFVLLGIMRYLQITLVEKNSGSPTEILMKDRIVQLALTGWLLTFGIIIYV